MIQPHSLLESAATEIFVIKQTSIEPATTLPRAMLIRLSFISFFVVAHVSVSCATNITGLTFSTCTALTNCSAYRLCQHYSTGTLISPNDDCTAAKCRCVPPQWKLCSSSDDCTAPETCAASDYSPFVCRAPPAVALSAYRIEDLRAGIAFAPATCPFLALPSPSPTSSVPYLAPTPTVSASPVVSGSSCTYGDHESCPSPLLCVTLAVAGPRCCSSPLERCVCLDPFPTTCSSSETCSQGSLCVRVRLSAPYCLAQAAVDLIDNSQLVVLEREDIDTVMSGVCIAAHHFSSSSQFLRNASLPRLLYEVDARANVLCDSSGSCATHGHMVLYRRRPMQMHEYCRQVGCRLGMANVNSPMYTTGWRLNSNTKALQFTAFAATFGTSAEGFLLSLLICFGF